jgi:AraC-like DNA-binding protein
MKLRITKLHNFDSLELKEATFQNIAFPEHFHDTFSIGLIKEGIEKVTVNNRTLISTPNSIVIINPFEAHSNSFYDNEKWTYCSLYLNNEILKYTVKKQNLNQKQRFQFKNIIADNSLYNLLNGFHANPTEKTESKLTDIVTHLVVNHQEESDTKPKHYAKQANAVNEIVAYFNNSFREKINIDTISTKYKLSSYQLIRAFKAHTGLTPIGYITLLKLNYAKKLILQNQPIVQVALECGFYDQSHFTHSFLKFFGTSPLNFKKNSITVY